MEKSPVTQDSTSIETLEIEIVKAMRENLAHDRK